MLERGSLPDKLGNACVMLAPATLAGSCGACVVLALELLSRSGGAQDIFSAMLGSPTMIFRGWPSASESPWGFNVSIEFFCVDPSLSGITPFILFAGRGFFNMLLGSWRGWDGKCDLSLAVASAPSCAAAAD